MLLETMIRNTRSNQIIKIESPHLLRCGLFLKVACLLHPNIRLIASFNFGQTQKK